MRFMKQGYSLALSVLGFIAGLTIAILAVMVSIDVIARNAGFGNFPWLIEVAEYAIYASTLMAAPWVLNQCAHVRVDVLVNVLPEQLRRGLELCMDGVGVCISVALVYYGALVTHEAYRLGARIFKELVVPEWWILMAVPVCGLLLGIEFVLRIIRGLGSDKQSAEARTQGF